MDLFDAGFSAVPYLSETASKFQQPLLTVFFILWVVSLYVKFRQNSLLHSSLAQGKVVVVDGVGSLLQAVRHVRYSHLSVIFRQRRQNPATVTTAVHKSGALPSVSCPPGNASGVADEAKLTAKLVFPAHAAGTCFVVHGIPSHLVDDLLLGGASNAALPVAAAGEAASATLQPPAQQQHSTEEGAAAHPEAIWDSDHWPPSVGACLRAAHSVRRLPLPPVSPCDATSAGSTGHTLAVDTTLAQLARQMGVVEPAHSCQDALQQIIEAAPCTPALVLYAPAADSPGGPPPPVQVVVLGVQGGCPSLLEGEAGAEWTMRFTQKAYLLLPGGAVHLDVVFGLEEGEENTCCVCLTEPKEVLLLPCRHLCVCTTCFEQLTRCPVCRASFESSLVVTGVATASGREEAEEEHVGGDASDGITTEEAADVEAVAAAMGGEAAVPTDQHRKAQTQ